MTAPRRGRPPKPADEVRTVRVTVLLTEREHATLLRACGGRGVATLLVRGGLREAEAMKPAIVGNPPSSGWTETAPHFVDNGLMMKSPGVDGRAVRMHLEIEIACEHFDRTLPGAMDGHTWRVHPAHRSESERYARDVARHARDRAREHCEDGDFWTPDEDKAARRYVSEMKTIDAMKRALESMERVERMRGSGATLAGALLDGATPERLVWLADVGEALTVTSGLRVGKTAAVRKVVAKTKAAGVPVTVVKR